MSEYLAIKNWAKFQPLRGKGRYIFDYTQQDDEPELMKLSFFQRGLYQEIRRYRGRTGHNILFDHEVIACATSARLKDRPRIPQAIRVLTACGLLVVTNQQVDVLETSDIEKEKDKDKEKDIKPKPSMSEPVIEQSIQIPEPKPEAVFDKAWDCYPRKEGKQAAEKAWGQAINREAKSCVRTYAEHEEFIYQRVMQYGAVMRRRLALGQAEKRFIPHMSRWLNAGRFLDDPSEWQEQRNGNGKSAAIQAEIDIGRNDADSDVARAAAYFRSLSDPNCKTCRGSGHDPRGGICACRIAKTKAMASSAGATAG